MVALAETEWRWWKEGENRRFGWDHVNCMWKKKAQLE